MKEYTKELAAFVAGTGYQDIPDEVRERACAVMADTLACAVAGYTKAPEECSWAIAMAREMGGREESTVWFTGEKVSPMAAGMANSTMVHTIDFDDTHLESVAHLGAGLLGTVFALGEKLHSSGSDVIAAFVLGFDVAARVGNSVNKGAVHHHYKYWHPTATAGTIGCAAAAAKLFGLNAEQTEMALGLGIDQAAGFRYCIDKGDFSKSMHPGLCALRGIISAQTIANGANGPRGLLEYPTGFCAAMCAEPNMDYLTDGLGKDWAIMKDALKMYPTIHGSHSGIEATLNVMQKYAIDSGDVERITIRMSPLAKGQGVNYRPANVLAARLSLPCCMAIAATKGHVTLDDFTEELIHDPDFIAYMEKVEVVPEPEFNKLYPLSGFTSEATITLKNGEKYTELVPYCKAHPERPASPEDLRDKFFQLCNLTWAEEKSRTVYDALYGLEKLDDVGLFTEHLRGEKN